MKEIIVDTLSRLLDQLVWTKRSVSRSIRTPHVRPVDASNKLMQKKSRGPVLLGLDETYRPSIIRRLDNKPRVPLFFTKIRHHICIGEGEKNNHSPYCLLLNEETTKI